MKDIILFLKSKLFRIHFFTSILVGALILWVSLESLSRYTHHGEVIIVPDFSNIKTEELDKFISGKNLNYSILDSVFDLKSAAGVVIKQDPEKNSSVKQNRIIYLTVSAKMPPMVKIPNLVDASMRQALSLLESYGLKVGKRDYRPDPCVNCVLEQTMKGKKIEAGTMVPGGSVIDLILGQGQDGEKINIPCVIGLSRKEAFEKFAESGFTEGAIICNDCKTHSDKETAKVYKQTPPCSDDIMLEPGRAIDLFISTTTKTIPAEKNDDE